MLQSPPVEFLAAALASPNNHNLTWGNKHDISSKKANDS